MALRDPRNGRRPPTWLESRQLQRSKPRQVSMTSSSSGFSELEKNSTSSTIAAGKGVLSRALKKAADAESLMPPMISRRLDRPRPAMRNPSLLDQAHKRQRRLHRKTCFATTRPPFEGFVRHRQIPRCPQQEFAISITAAAALRPRQWRAAARNCFEISGPRALDRFEKSVGLALRAKQQKGKPMEEQIRALTARRCRCRKAISRQRVNLARIPQGQLCRKNRAQYDCRT